MRSNTSRLPAALLATALLGGCFGSCVGCMTAASPEVRRRAEDAVLQFHVRLNKGEIDAIWDAAGKELHGAVSREDFTRLLEAVHRKLGSEQFTRTKDQQVMGRPGGALYTLVQETKFDRGTGIETFVFKVEWNQVALVGYHINSMDLLAN